MRKTTLLAAAALLSRPGLTLAQNTPDENNPNVDAPFVRNIRADRPGQTISAQVLPMAVGATRMAPWARASRSQFHRNAPPLPLPPCSAMTSGHRRSGV